MHMYMYIYIYIHTHTYMHIRQPAYSCVFVALSLGGYLSYKQ